MERMPCVVEGQLCMLYYHDGEWHIRDMKETEAEVVQEETDEDRMANT